MKEQILDITSLQQQIAQFAAERDWNQFHTPKNLAMALSVEAGELVELFQWLSAEQSFLTTDKQRKQAVAEELSDILTYLVRIADILQIDLPHALQQKIEQNGRKYPVEQAKGNAKKYTEF